MVSKKNSSIATSAPASAPAPSLPDEILTVEEVAALLKVEKSCIFSWTRRRAKIAEPIPFKHMGKFLRFQKSAVLRWFENLDSETTVGRPRKASS